MQKQQDDYFVLKLQVPQFLNGHSQVLLLFFLLELGNIGLSVITDFILLNLPQCLSWVTIL
jgi:hypothetical protein